jgi:hypothetical protein
MTGAFFSSLLIDHGEEDETIMDASSVILAFLFFCKTSSSLSDGAMRAGDFDPSFGNL